MYFLSGTRRLYNVERTYFWDAGERDQSPKSDWWFRISTITDAKIMEKGSQLRFLDSENCRFSRHVAFAIRINFIPHICCPINFA